MLIALILSLATPAAEPVPVVRASTASLVLAPQLNRLQPGECPLSGCSLNTYGLQALDVEIGLAYEHVAVTARALTLVVLGVSQAPTGGFTDAGTGIQVADTELRLEWGADRRALLAPSAALAYLVPTGAVARGIHPAASRTGVGAVAAEARLTLRRGAFAAWAGVDADHHFLPPWLGGLPSALPPLGIGCPPGAVDALFRYACTEGSGGSRVGLILGAALAGLDGRVGVEGAGAWTEQAGGWGPMLGARTAVWARPAPEAPLRLALGVSGGVLTGAWWQFIAMPFAEASFGF